MTKHIFENMCIDFAPLLASPSISKMLKAAEKQAKTTEAKKRADFANYKDYEPGQWSPMYFGMFFEWFAAQYLSYFGHFYNLHCVVPLQQEGSAVEDLGTDIMSKSIADRSRNKTARCVRAGAPGFVQAKGVLDPTKELMTNDGSRISNFVMNALSTAVTQGHAYTARFILITTAKGIHYKLNKASNGVIEVIGFAEINKHTKNNIDFLNVLREKVGLPALPVAEPPLDVEAAYNMAC